MLRNFFKKVKDTLNTPVDELFSKKDWSWDDLEEMLIENDISYKVVEHIVDTLKKKKLKTAEETKEYLREIIVDIMDKSIEERDVGDDPKVYLFIGVNGTGKTTSIGKLALMLKKEGYKVLLVAADTFRPAATEQLEIWADRAKTEIIKGQTGADPASLVFDGINAAKSRGYDIVLVDTAGRMHTNDNLMREMEKIYRVIKKVSPHNPYRTLIVIDAVTGKNALSQVSKFTKTLPVDGIVLTKLDGTATGGTVISIAHEMNMPVLYVGTGETIDDFEPFNIDDFVNAIVGIKED